MTRWSTERAWEWYRGRPWIRGFNYVAGDAVNRIEQWQAFGHEKRAETIDREFALAARHGFNAVRSIMPFDVWRLEHDGYMERLEAFIATAARHGISVMIVFGNDCVIPRELIRPVDLSGPQPVDWGYHGGTARSPHAGLPQPGWNVLDDAELAAQFETMVDEIVGRYARDPRVNIWDIFNEPGNSRREMMSANAMRRLFEIARSHDPIQPLTAGPWRVNRSGELPEIEQIAMDLSDVISYHDYLPYSKSVQIIDRLRREGRPMLNTEWLHRMQGNDVATHLPLFYLERIGCYHWGLVVGPSQTHEPWDAIWGRYDRGEGEMYDFTKWQHDLFRPQHRPYDPREMKVFAEYFALADAEFEAGRW